MKFVRIGPNLIVNLEHVSSVLGEEKHVIVHLNSGQAHFVSHEDAKPLVHFLSENAVTLPAAPEPAAEPAADTPKEAE